MCTRLTCPPICEVISTAPVNNSLGLIAAVGCLCRYVHEADVPTNLETQEALTDWALDRMGLAEGEDMHA
jgi:hypothetical protein